MKHGAMLFFFLTGLTGLNGLWAQESDSVRRPPKSRLLDRLDLSAYPTRDSVERAMEAIPLFGIYKDNFFLTGTNFQGGVNKDNSDVKFQVSLLCRLAKGVLPGGTHLFFTYTQLSLWDFYKKSAPFRENIFNPTIGIGKNFTIENHVIGVGFLQIEHESNGRDSTFNRGWNKVSFTAIFAANKNFDIQFKAWIPFWIAKENKDIAQYAGYWHLVANYQTPNRRFSFTGQFVKRGGWDFNGNVLLEAAFRLSKKGSYYLGAQWYNGYGEGRINYNAYRNFLRIGFIVKPDRWFSLY